MHVLATLDPLRFSYLIGYLWARFQEPTFYHGL